MSQQLINSGTFDDDPTAETRRSAFTKINAMTLELFGANMGREVINTGAFLNDPTADSCRTAFGKINNMTTELYALFEGGSTSRGPQIIAHTGTVDIAPGATTIHSAVANNPAGTAFWLSAGTYQITTPISPKTGQTFTGEFGAIISGSTWITSDRDDAAFRAIDNGVTGVTIQNLVISTCPEYGINSYKSASGWTVDHCEIHHCRSGVAVGSGGTVSSNLIHHNTGIFGDPDASLRGGGYVFFSTTAGISLINNEISYNGTEQKFGYGSVGTSEGHLISDNFVHHNLGNGIWIDSNGSGTIIEDNVVEDNAFAGIDVENSHLVTVQNNTVRRSGAEGIYITVTKDSTISGNTLEDNAYGISLYLDFSAMPPDTPSFPWTQDLSGNTISNNTVRIPSGSSKWGGMLTVVGVGDTTPYLTNTKANNWTTNIYRAPTTNGNNFYWNANKTFAQWQALGQDTGGSIAVG